MRDDIDTGDYKNALNLPYGEYEAAFAIQDKMLKENGELFYPANKDDPGYADFIGNILDPFPDDFPDGGVSFKIVNACSSPLQ